MTTEPEESRPVEIGMRFDASVRVGDVAQRTWQRKWRDVQHERQALAAAYAGPGLDTEGLNRRVESFFKTCRELGDWIQESKVARTSRYIHKKGSALKVCDAVAQTAKHFKRRPDRKRDPITAIVVEVHNDHQQGIHADIAWNSKGGNNGQEDALKLADRCIAEWQAFFQARGLNPNG